MKTSNVITLALAVATLAASVASVTAARKMRDEAVTYYGRAAFAVCLNRHYSWRIDLARAYIRGELSFADVAEAWSDDVAEQRRECGKSGAA